ncbi:MAG TPA: c-type cytochrome [Acidiferrobacteraceae bacterium]|nr:c-type cytochrome [Acidiferrobacteraceae bacterium]
MYRMFLLVAMIGLAHPVYAAVDGAGLYVQNCAACHGAQGGGGVGVPLSLHDFLDSVSNEYLRKTIRLGRQGRVMPSFRKLSDDDVNAIVQHIRGWSHKQEGSHAAPVFSAQPIKGDAIRGKALFDKNCATCHGVNGEGGAGTGVTMSRPRNWPILAPALNNPGFLASASDEMIKATLMKGRNGTPMVSFLKQGLSKKDINDVVAYVRAFEKSSGAKTAEVLSSESAVIVRESPYSVEQTVASLKSTILGNNFRLIRIQPLDQGFVERGKENKKRVLVYSCNFNFLNEALKVDPRVGLFLPCRVTVMEHKGKVLVMTINPKRLSAIFNNSELNRLCEEMSKIYVEMIEEAIL